MKRITLSSLFSLFLLPTVFAQTFNSLSFNTMWGLDGVLAGGSGTSVGRWISADGTTIVGYAYNETNVARAIRWSSLNNKQDLGTFRADNSGAALAHGVNYDGSIVVGHAVNNTNNTRAFKWTEAGGLQDLGTLRAGNVGNSAAYAISANGSVVVGFSQHDAASGNHAVRWSATGGIQDLGTLRADNSGTSESFGVSADGTTVVGYAQYQAGSSAFHAFKWTAASGMQDLGSLRADNLGSSNANGISADNKFIVGGAQNDQNEMRAVIWNEAGQARDLGTLRADNRGTSYGRGISADGSVVVGVSDNDLGTTLGRAFVWTERDGIEDLGTLRADNSGRSEAYSVSADGKIITGWASSDDGFRAFIYKRRKMQDFENLHRSFPVLGAQKERIAAYQQQSMSHLLATQCSVGSAGENCFKVSSYYSYAGSSPTYNSGEYQQIQGILTLGRGLSNQWTVGANLSIADERFTQSAVSPKAAYAFSLWGTYSQSGMAGTGLQADASVGYYTQDTTITRGKDLANVEQVRGSSNLDTFAARLGIGFGIKPDSDWLITPQVALIYQTTAFDAYQETNGVMNASYKKSTLNATMLHLRLTAQYAINNMSAVSLGIGLEQDIAVDDMKMEGTSDIPYFETFNLKSSLDRNKTRPFAVLGYRYNLSQSSSIFAGIKVIQDPYFDNANLNVALSYSVRF